MAGAELLSTPTWAIACTCFIFITISLLVERLIHFIGHGFMKRKQAALQEALEKIKEELMLVGFISLTLTVGQERIASICMPERWAGVMLQCSSSSSTSQAAHYALVFRRGLAASAEGAASCPPGKAPFITVGTLHQLHILIFVLAITHVIYSVITMALGIWKVHKWRAWEEKAREDSLRGNVRLARDSTFVRKRATGAWSTNTFLAYVAAFIQQFSKSVSEIDYSTLRNGFVKIHMPRNTVFDFHKYILRALEDDFKYVVGISPALWGYTVVLLILNIDGWVTSVWAACAPLILVLVVGTKLQRIITKMAVTFVEKQAVVEGLPDVQPNDRLFWFNRPQFILSCIHFILYQNAFELAFYLWSSLSFSREACLNRSWYLILIRLLVGAFGQLICAYITLPIYAVVSQMGSSMKAAIFEDHVQVGLVNWQKRAKGRKGGPVNGGGEAAHEGDVEEADDPPYQAEEHEIAPQGVQDNSSSKRQGSGRQGFMPFRSEESPA